MLASTISVAPMMHTGGEFTGIEFQKLLEKCHIKDACTSAKNTQSNAICERMYQTVGNVLRTLLHGEPPQNIANAKDYVDEALSCGNNGDVRPGRCGV